MSNKSAEILRINRTRVNSLLAGRDLRASDLAQELGISCQYLSDMLHGRRNAKPHIARIATFLGVSTKRITVSHPSAAPTTGGEQGAHALAASST
jgi:plasmid maintenance system antidote protein VapI